LVKGFGGCPILRPRRRVGDGCYVWYNEYMHGKLHPYDEYSHVQFSTVSCHRRPAGWHGDTCAAMSL